MPKLFLVSWIFMLMQFSVFEVLALWSFSVVANPTAALQLSFGFTQITQIYAEKVQIRQR
ncbi:MAG: hypothetical protein M0R50_03760 [Candidatus Cloacimonetes bacterium]|nr:hypothetical protein [Candidatus Cloacimonadota bacterium]